MATSIDSVENGTVWGRVTRTRHSSTAKFKRSRVVLPTSYFTGSAPMVETDFPASLFFTVSLEPVFDGKITGLATRSLSYTFSGAASAAPQGKGPKVGVYNGPGTNPTRVIKSDWLDHTEIAANQDFGLWTVVENQLGVGSPSNSLPMSWNASSYINRFEGSRSNTAQDPGVSYIDTNAAETRTSISAFNAGRSGIAGGFFPALLEAEFEHGVICVYLLGDSMCAGVGAGVLGPTAADTPPVPGDVEGTAKRSRGYPAVGMELLGLNYVNGGKGSDGYKNLYLDGNMVARLEYIKAANPQFIVMQNIFNDASLFVSEATWMAQVATVYDRIRQAAPGVKIIQATAVPGVSPTRSVVALSYVNATNTATATVASTADLIEGQTVTHSGGSVSGLNIRAAIHIVDATHYTFQPPSALGADQTPTGTILYNNEYRSPAGQTPNVQFAPGQTRSAHNQSIRTRAGPFADIYAIFDPNLACEEGYNGTQASETGKWRASPGLSFKWTWDGSHQNNSGQLLIGAEFQSQAVAQGWFS